MFYSRKRRTRESFALVKRNKRVFQKDSVFTKDKERLETFTTNLLS